MRQLRRLKLKSVGSVHIDAETWESFLTSISQSYEQADKDKHIIEHSLKLASDELTQRNRELRKNVSELEKNQAIISFQANHDALTQLPNRAFFMEKFNQVIASRNKAKKLALLFIDLDYFKEVNDTYGHQVGDDLLRIISRRLLNCLRSQDLLARIGGDEFLLLLDDIEDTSFVNILGQRMLKEINKPCHIEGKIVNVSGSIGVSIFPADATDSEGLIHKADSAMYRSKESGKNSINYYN